LLGANLLYLLAGSLIYQSIRLLDGEKPQRGIYLYVVAPAILLMLAARYVVDAYSARVVMMSAALSLLLALTSHRLFVGPRATSLNPGRRPAAYWLATAAALLAVRAVGTAALGGAPRLLGEGALPPISVAVGVIIGLGAVFAYFLVFSGRVTAELAVQAHLDPLTELLNRRGFEERAKQELQRAARSGAPVSLLMVDANEFKTINDNWGHAAGDKALCAIADGLRGHLRPYDLVARLGGDEFVALLPGTDGRAAAALAPRLREAIAGQPTDHGGRLDVSIGIANVEGQALLGGPGSEEAVLRRLLAEADGALYGVKHTRY